MKRERLKLTKTNIRKLKPEADRYEVTDTDNTGLRLRVTPNGIMTFVLVYRNAENQLKRYTIGKFGVLTPEQARAIAETKQAEIKLGQDPAAVKQEKRQAAKREQFLTLRGFLDHKYGPWAKANRKGGADTVKRLESCFPDLLEKRIDEITPWLVEKWRRAKLERGRAPSTTNREIAALKACLSKAVDWDLIEVHPLARVKPAKVDSAAIVRYLSTDEEQRLRSALTTRDDRIKQEREQGNQWREQRHVELLPTLVSQAYGDHLTPMVLLSVNTGMRRGEVFTLRWSDVNLNGQSLAIRGESAKSGKTRHVPLNVEAVVVLEKWKTQQQDTRGLVFPSKAGNPFNNVTKAWAGLMEAAGIENFRWHDMRHHFASRLVMAGVDLNTVRELLGHSDIKMTLRYAHLAPEHKAAAVARLMEVR